MSFPQDGPCQCLWGGHAPQRTEVTLPSFQAFALSRPWALGLPPAHLPHDFPVWLSFSVEERDCGAPANCAGTELPTLLPIPEVVPSGIFLCL